MGIIINKTYNVLLICEILSFIANHDRFWFYAFFVCGLLL